MSENKIKLQLLGPLGDVNHELVTNYPKDQLDRFLSQNRITILSDEEPVHLVSEKHRWSPVMKEKISLTKGELEAILAEGMGYVWNLNQDEKGIDGYHKKEEKRIEIVNQYFNIINQNKDK